jgi:hypothetical protein
LIATKSQGALHGLTVAGLAQGAALTGEVSLPGRVCGPVHGPELFDRDPGALSPWATSHARCAASAASCCVDCQYGRPTRLRRR